MSEPSRTAELRERIRELISSRQEAQRRKQDALGARMAEVEDRERGLKSLIPEILSRTSRPRLKLLEESFDDARLEPSGPEGWARVIFNTKDLYPASICLEMGASADALSGNLHVRYRFKVIPILMDFEAEDVLSVALEEFEEQKVAAFVEEKVFQAARTYLDLQAHPAYQKVNLVTDPVCGMRINRAEAAGSVEHAGKTYYFCVAACRDRFLEAPERYAGPGK